MSNFRERLFWDRPHLKMNYGPSYYDNAQLQCSIKTRIQSPGMSVKSYLLYNSGLLSSDYLGLWQRHRGQYWLGGNSNSYKVLQGGYTCPDSSVEYDNCWNKELYWGFLWISCYCWYSLCASAIKTIAIREHALFFVRQPNLYFCMNIFILYILYIVYINNTRYFLLNSALIRFN